MPDAKTPPALDTSGWQEYLSQDETILWQGRPATGISWRGGAMGTVVIGAVMLAFITFGLWDTWRYRDGSDPFTFGDALGVLVFAGIAALVMLSGPVGLHLVRLGTWYTLTNRRAIIAHWPTLFGVTVYRGLDCYPITEVAVAKSDVQGLMTAHFSRMDQRHTFVAGDGWRKTSAEYSRTDHTRRAHNHPVGFERIADAAQVAELCRNVQADPHHMDWAKAR